jgi:integrase
MSSISEISIRRGDHALPKNVKSLEAVKPRRRRAAYTISGERGLRLVVHPTGRKVWYAVYQLGSGANLKRKWHEIGPYSTHEDGWTLAKACEENCSIQGALETAGLDPAAPKTFAEMFNAWLDQHAKEKLGTWQDEQRRYRLHLEKPLGSRKVADIERKDVRDVRDTVLEEAGPIQSNRVVALFNRVMNWAVDEDHAKFNPAARLKKVGEEKRRERVLSLYEMKRLWSELDRDLAVDAKLGGITFADLPAAGRVRRAIKLLFATGQRRGEVIGMAKSELDLSEGEAWWTIPGERTKNGLPHRVPLTKTALAILRVALDDSGKSEFVFPSPKTDGPIRADAVTKTLERMCARKSLSIEGLGPHDIRRTVGTMMRKLGISVDERGYVFNHISGAKSKVTSWNNDAGEHDDEKRRALEVWDRELRRIIGLDAPSAKVVELAALRSA